jgi:hypothetical protein
MRGSTLVGGIAMALLASAALGQTSVDRSFTTVTKDCEGVRWSDAALKAYPNISSACQGVEERNGKTYVKFSGTVEENLNRGEELRIDFKEGDTMTLSPPPNTRLFVNGKQTPVSELRRGDELNFYVPNDQLVAQVAENDAAQPQYVVVPIEYREVVREPAQQQAASLPHTAGDLPLVALGGMMLLGLGGGLTLVRLLRFPKR